MDDPTLLTKFDFLGNRLDLRLDEMRDASGRRANGYGHAASPEFRVGIDYEAPAFFRPGFPIDDPARWSAVAPIRQQITPIGAGPGWDRGAVPSHREPAPFDGPMLGIVGMWRQGGGADPHFALAIGETMLRAGQRSIARAAYERAARMGDNFWPNPDVREKFNEHCRRRQAQVERSLRPPPEAGPPRQHETVANLRPAFDAELAHGLRFRQEFQAYEAKQLADGVPITDPHFYDAFYADRQPIASPTGPEETFARVPRSRISAYAARRARGALGAGIGALIAGLILRAGPARESALPDPVGEPSGQAVQ